MPDCFYLVKTTSSKQSARIARFIREHAGLGAGDPVTPVGAHRLLVTPEAAASIGNNHARFVSAMTSRGAVELVELTDEHAVTLLAAREPSELPFPKAKAASPVVGDQYDWHLQAARVPGAWSQINGGNFDSIDWSGIKVGQIDTGFCEHPVLGWSGGVSTTIDTANDRNLFPGDFSLTTYSPDDAHDPLLGAPNAGHGTRTGSVLAGFSVRTQNADSMRGYFGAAPKVPYIPVRISDSIAISHVQAPLADAIKHLTSSGCRVITLSLGFPLIFGGGVQRVVCDAINFAYDRGVIFVCAAGNIVRKVVAPAALGRTIAIGGSTSSDEAWTSSSRGSEVDVSAPAWPIYRASVDKDGNPTYGFGDGTSFATALVAGVAALWLARHGTAIGLAYTAPWQVVAAFKKLLRDTARAPAGWDTSQFGTGIVDAAALLSAALPSATSLQKESSI